MSGEVLPKGRYCLCVVGWHFFEGFYDQIRQLSCDQYIVSHRDHGFLSRQRLFEAIHKDVLFFPNRGRDWGAYHQFNEAIGLRDYDFVIYCHDDLIIKDLSFFETVARMFQNPDIKVVSIRGKRKTDFRFGRYRERMAFDDDDGFVVRTIAGSVFAASTDVFSTIGDLPDCWAAKTRKEGRASSRSFSYLVTKKFGIDRIAYLDRDDWFETRVLSDLRQIDRVIVVTGPTSSGKTTLARALLEDGLPRLSARLGVASFQGWRYSSAHRIDKHEMPATDGLVLHYDFLRPLKDKAKSYTSDPALRLLDRARKLSIVTVWTPPQRLRDQFHRSETASKERPVPNHVFAAYQNPTKIVELYHRWFDFCDARFPRAEQHVVESNEGLRVMNRGEWEAQVLSRVGMGGSS